MIDEIVVRNIALIREASMEPARGLTVLTGETGAGKTALLSALKLLMGERADKGAVREGEESAQVEGRFFVNDEEIVVTRRVSADGRSRATVDGCMASVGELAARIAPMVDLCSQHEHQRLMKASTHVEMLDAWTGEAAMQAREAYRSAFCQVEAAKEELARVREAAAATGAKLDEARFMLRQIDSVGLIEGEYEELAAYLSKAEHAEAFALAAHSAYAALAGDDGAIDALAAAAQALEGVAAYDAQLGACAEQLREVGYVVEDVAREALSYRDAADYDPQVLAESQERMSALQGLMRVYGPRFEDVVARRAEAADLVSLVDDAQERERVACEALDAAEAVLAEAAVALEGVRAEAAPRFAAAVSAHMARLEMGSAELVCAVEPLERAAWTKQGPSSVEFLFRPGAGMQARPLARIASGGEVSRVMLAVKVVLGETDDVGTLVFDEVDAGVGGATAVALADVLADLSRTHQVIVVTHLAQVAVRAETHYVVSKSGGDVPETALSIVSGDDRVAEIARMLSGSATEASLAHAREMLS